MNGEWVYYGDNTGEYSEIKKISLKTKEVLSTPIKNSYHAMESHDKNFFFLKENQTGIWEIDKNGKEVKVIDDFYDRGISDWMVTPDGIYYILYETSNTPSLYFYDFSGNTAKKIDQLAETGHFIKGLSIYKNEIYYSVSNDTKCDILLMEVDQQ